MRALSFLISLALSSSVALGQASTTAPAFDVASVKLSQRVVGPDYNNQLTYTPTGMTARNVTLKRLVAEAYHLQLEIRGQTGRVLYGNEKPYVAVLFDLCPSAKMR